jgi:hypothetical protein
MRPAAQSSMEFPATVPKAPEYLRLIVSPMDELVYEVRATG